MIYEQRLDAVDPIALAVASGAYKARRFAAPIPPVATPFLLTGQLKKGLGMGCDCTSGGMAAAMIPPDYGTLAQYEDATLGHGQYYFPEGMGQYDASGMNKGLGQAYSCPTTYSQQNLGVPSAGSGSISILQTVANGAHFIPGIGTIGGASIQTALQAIKQFEAWFHIGAGRTEANIIVPVQNQLMTHLGTITAQILTGSSVDVATLQGLYRDVWASAVAFQEFVLMCQFRDRRASGQALNTVMPYIDGSCGYQVPAGMTETPGQWNCLSWGDGTLGGVGQNGMLGAIGRAITNAGGSIPALPDLHQSANSGIQPGQINSPIFGVGGVLPPTIAGISTPLILAGVVAFFLLRR